MGPAKKHTEGYRQAAAKQFSATLPSYVEASLISVLVEFVIYATLATAGYLSFRGGTEQDEGEGSGGGVGRRGSDVWGGEARF